VTASKRASRSILKDVNALLSIIPIGSLPLINLSVFVEKFVVKYRMCLFQVWLVIAPGREAETALLV
jgi:hypothetical protein